MKKTISIICMIALSAGTVMQAQLQDNDRREKISIGGRAGINVSNVWDATGEDFVADPKTGFAGGIFIGIPMGKYLGIQPEFLVSQKGFRGSGTILAAPYSFSKTTTFIDIPLQLQLKPVSFLTIVAGPQFSYMIKEKNTYTLGGNVAEQEEAFAADNIRKNILGFGVGIDAIISRLVLSGRLGWDMQDNHGDGTSSTPRYKNQWVQFTLGIKL
ncbi:MAG: porin family protein [Bacteroidales bacterium]